MMMKWSLRLADHKYRTKGKKKYGQTRLEERRALIERSVVIFAPVGFQKKKETAVIPIEFNNLNVV